MEGVSPKAGEEEPRDPPVYFSCFPGSPLPAESPRPPPIWAACFYQRVLLV